MSDTNYCSQCRELRPRERLGLVKVIANKNDKDLTVLHIIFCTDNEMCLCKAIEETRTKSAGIVHFLSENPNKINVLKKPGVPPYDNISLEVKDDS